MIYPSVVSTCSRFCRRVSLLLTAAPPPLRGAAMANTPKKSSAVLYHYPCPDGAFAALAAHIFFSSTSTPALFFPNTVYNPIKAEELHLHEIGDLYLLDFVGPPGFVQQISAQVDRVVILDHHKTALEMLATEDCLGKNPAVVIDMGRSGATIAFDYFMERLRESSDREDRCMAVSVYDGARRLFEYIEDADLWRWKLPDSKAFSSGLKDMNIEFNVRSNPTLFEQLLSLDADSTISQGLVSLEKKQQLIDKALSCSFEISLGDGVFGHCLAVSADSISELRSELGHQLANKSLGQKLRGIAAVVYRVPELKNDQLLKISLRSVADEDTTIISKEFGGGGHRNASSFMLSSAEFEQWKVK